MTKHEASAGVIVVSLAHGDPRFLLLKSASYWGFPKGHVERGETAREAALRELREETGIREISLLPGFERGTSYVFRGNGGLVAKRVTFFLGVVGDERFSVSEEHESAGWFALAEAKRRARFANLRALLDEAAAVVERSRSPIAPDFRHRKIGRD